MQTELEGLAAGESRLKAAAVRIKTLAQDVRRDQGTARSLVELLALTQAGALLLSHAPAAVSDAFLATRLDRRSRQTYGAAAVGADTSGIVTRAAPARA